MHIEELREYCMSIKGATESFPFLDDSILVFKVMDRMFAYIGIQPKDGEFYVNLKCDPERSLTLRERYRGITRGQHSNGPLWNAVYLKSDVPDSLIRELISHSVEGVIKNLSKKKQEEYRNM